jgi:hypothetical protein
MVLLICLELFQIVRTLSLVDGREYWIVIRQVEGDDVGVRKDLRSQQSRSAVERTDLEDALDRRDLTDAAEENPMDRSDPVL